MDVCMIDGLTGGFSDIDANVEPIHGTRLPNALLDDTSKRQDRLLLRHREAEEVGLVPKWDNQSVPI